LRRAHTDRAAKPVQNLATNPRGETSSGNTTIATNLCTNPRGVNAFAAYASAGNQTITPNVTISGHPEGLTTANRVEYTNGANAGVALINPTTSGTIYTVSAWVYIEALNTTPGTIGYAQAGVVQGTTAANTVGVWQKITWTHTASGTSLIGFRASAQSGGTGSFLITGVMIENANIANPFFDGATPAAGDYTYAWAGTANASQSWKRAPGVTGVSPGNAIAHQTSEWAADGTKGIRLVPQFTNAAPTTSSTSATVPVPTLTPGKTYTVLATRRLTAPLTGGALNSAYGGKIALIQPGLTTLQSEPALPNAAGVGQVRWTFTVDPAATGHTLRLGHGGQYGSGDVYWDKIMVAEGTYDGDYIDGTLNLCKWDGTADASTSTGYPPQLQDIAGKPEADIVGVGTIASYAVSALGPRTFYFVYEVTNTDGAFVSPYQYGGADDRFVFQSNSAGTTSMAPRADFPGGDTNSTGLLNGARAAAKVHVHAISFNQGLTQAEFHYNGTLTLTKNYSPGTGWDDGRLIAQNVTGINPRRGMVFHAQHDAATKIAISRYLGNKYSANVA
jgi:hypothetical protein